MPYETPIHTVTAEHDPLSLHARAISRASHLAITDTGTETNHQIPTTPETLDSPEKTVENIRHQLADILDSHLLAKRTITDANGDQDAVFEPSNIAEEPAFIEFHPSGALLPENLWAISKIAITSENEIFGKQTLKPYDGWLPADARSQASIRGCAVVYGESPQTLQGVHAPEWSPLDSEQQTALLIFLEHIIPTPGQPVTVSHRRLHPTPNRLPKKYVSAEGYTVAVKQDHTVFTDQAGTVVDVTKWNGRPSRPRSSNREWTVRTTLTAQP